MRGLLRRLSRYQTVRSSYLDILHWSNIFHQPFCVLMWNYLLWFVTYLSVPTTYLLGVAGDANIACHQPQMILKRIGEDCNRNTDCVYGVCNTTCAAPSLQCPSNAPGDYSSPVRFADTYKHGSCIGSAMLYALSPFRNNIRSRSRFPGLTIPLHTKLSLYWALDNDCSGNGKCVYTDPSGNKLQSCTIFDTACTATCLCPKFGGKDCSLDEHASLSRNNVR